MEPATHQTSFEALLPHPRVLVERPLFAFAIYLCLGIASCTALPLWLPAGLMAVAVLALTCFLLLRKQKNILIPAMALAFAAGYTLAAGAIPQWAGDPWAPGTPVELAGRIVEVRTTSGGYAGYVLQDVTIGGEAVEGGVALTVLRGDGRGSVGDLLRAPEAELERPQPSLYYGGFNVRGWYMRKGVRFSGFAATASFLRAERQPSLLDLPERARQYSEDTLYRYLDPDSAALVNALLSGDTGGIAEDTRRAFMDLGVAHLLAVSGLNISLTAGAAWFLCRRLRLPMPVSLAASFLVMAGYVLFAGPAPSVLRAAAMWLVGMGALVAARRYDPLSSLGAAAILILAVNPLDLYDAGFQLSFAATAAMFLWLAPLMRHVPQKKWMKRFIGALGVTVCVTIVALPVIVGYFNSVSLVSPLANLVLVPTSFAMQLGGMALLALSPFPPAAALLGRLLNGYTAFYLQNVKILSWSAATLPVASPPVWLAAAFVVLVLFASPAVARFSKQGRGRLAVLLALALVGAVMLSPISASLASRRGDAAIVAEGRSSLSVVWRQGGARYAACAPGITGMAGYLASIGVGRLQGLYLLSDEPPEGEDWFDDLGGIVVEKLYVPALWLEKPEAQPFLTRAKLRGMEPRAAESGPLACVAGGGDGLVLLLPAGGGTAAFSPDAAAAIGAAERFSSGSALLLLAAKPGRQAEKLLQSPWQGVVLPGEIAAGAVPRYNIGEVGSLEIVEWEGAMALVPWIGGWADGLQGNFQ